MRGLIRAPERLKVSITAGAVVLAMALSLFSACEPPESQGAFYSLQEAYDNGWLTQEDLRSIAYYHHGGKKAVKDNLEHKLVWMDEEEGYTPIPITPEVLDAETEKQIKQTRVNERHDEGNKSKAKDISIVEYYGVYNGCIAVMLTERGYRYERILNGNIVNDIRFLYGTVNQILIWKEKS